MSFTVSFSSSEQHATKRYTEVRRLIEEFKARTGTTLYRVHTRWMPGLCSCDFCKWKPRKKK